MTILASNQNSVRAGSQPDSAKLSWQQQMKSAIRSVKQLCDELDLPQKFKAKVAAAEGFPTFVPPAFLARIEKENPDDPLLKQVLPVAAEDHSPAHFNFDPLQESDVNDQPGMLHKYKGRVLLVTTGACAIHCRYCFRRHFPYEQSPKSDNAWMPAIEAIKQDQTIEEILLSGGDPLTLVDENLYRLISKLESVSHLRRLRIHTRLPIVIPSRVTDSLIDTLSGSRLQTVMVVHVNHAREIDNEVQSVLERLGSAGVMLFNQSVLLRGVNDSSKSLIDLSKRLIECNVVPYYLHQLDQVAGASHFEVDKEVGKRLIAEMRAALPGYAVPRYVQEIPGRDSKTVLA